MCSFDDRCRDQKGMIYMKQYNRILFVAESGTSRAPMAAGILSEYTLKHPVTIECRGLVVLFPEPLNQKAEAVMISNGINWENFIPGAFGFVSESEAIIPGSIFTSSPRTSSNISFVI